MRKIHVVTDGYESPVMAFEDKSDALFMAGTRKDWNTVEVALLESDECGQDVEPYCSLVVDAGGKLTEADFGGGVVR